MQFKAGVISDDVQQQIWFAVGIAALLSDTYRATELVITSMRDGQHMQGSLHYVGRAVDLRTIGSPNALNTAYFNALRYILQPLGFDVILEESPPHIHIEYDPKDGREWLAHWTEVSLTPAKLLKSPKVNT